MAKRCGLIASLVSVVIVGALANQDTPAFEVASIKPNRTGATRSSIGGQSGRWRMVNARTAGLILAAYPMRTDELVGAPAWVTTDRYDVEARAPFVPTPEQERAMLRALLAERFRFSVHVEARERPIYNLVVARADGRLGPQIRRIETDCGAGKPDPAARVTVAPGIELPPCSHRMSAEKAVRLLSGGRTLSEVALILTGTAGRPVFDKTGLPGYYAFALDYADQDPDMPSLFTALQEQLGLKLEAARGSVDVLVIDHIERPTED